MANIEKNTRHKHHRLRPTCEKILSYIQRILLFLLYSYVKSHFDNDSCLPIYKTIPAICNILRQTQCITECHFFALHHGDYLLWAAKLWFVVVCWCVK